jgi:hypothetical protein
MAVSFRKILKQIVSECAEYPECPRDGDQVADVDYKQSAPLQQIHFVLARASMRKLSAGRDTMLLDLNVRIVLRAPLLANLKASFYRRLRTYLWRQEQNGHDRFSSGRLTTGDGKNAPAIYSVASSAGWRTTALRRLLSVARQIGRRRVSPRGRTRSRGNGASLTVSA